MKDPSTLALFVKHRHELRRAGTLNGIRKTILVLIHLAQAGEMAIKCLVEVCTVAITQGKTCVKHDDALRARIEAHVKNGLQILHRIIDVGEERAQPYNVGNAGLPECPQSAISLGGC